MFSGSITALVTPFAQGKVDERTFQDLVAWQVSEGSHGVVPCGTTGESPTLSHAEHRRLIELAVEAVDRSVPVIAGSGSNSTEEAIDFSRHAEKVGADALLIVAPYYNKPTQEGIYQHFRAIASEVSLPIIVYNIPARSVIDVSVETLARLRRDCDNIVGVKDATANLLRPSLERIACGTDFTLLSGEDGTALGYMAHGGHGCISVTSNIAPRLYAEFQNACSAGNFRDALAIQDRLMPLHRALFLETNPSGAKYALSRLGRMKADVRLPLVGVSVTTQAEIDLALQHAGLVT
ncbi:4-hydroxy-tetrahydrodipicolinate synthase [Agrobacterium tumefaciens]|uniref:4-hydroxy-tetrahydrodipicolinate synthase n=1 Tax=Agrobacterium tumefaciens TaxID=358 RepID=UPI00122FBE59|nr:4-hydroxy-tetrahydrodipicolinate synthase [Agrobacterium tumefaciens]